MIVREMTIDDIDVVAAMEAEDSQTPWNRNALLTYFMREDTILMVAEEDSIIGFCGILLLTPESEILDITVHHDARNKGIGYQLLSSVLDAAKQRGIDTTYLEVRDSNAPARRLYEKLDFEAYGRRKNYYTEPVEDAIVMKTSLL